MIAASLAKIILPIMKVIARGTVYGHNLAKKDYETQRAMTVNEIKATVNDYRTASANAEAAGFNGVEIHSTTFIHDKGTQ